MKAKEFHHILTLIKANIKKHGKEGIVVLWVDDSNIEFSHVKWKQTINFSILGFIQLVEVGYFIFENKTDFDLFVAQKIQILPLTINTPFFQKKHTRLGMTQLIQNLVLISALLSLLISFLMYLSQTESKGLTRFSRAGNSFSDDFHRINWFHALIIGCSLFVAFLSIKTINHFSNKTNQ